jgi:hypothetical protein
MEQAKEVKYMGTTPVQLLKIMLVEHNNNLIMAYEQYYKLEGSGCLAQTNIIRARTIVLFKFIESHLRKNLKPNLFTQLKDKCFSAKIEKLENAFSYIQSWLYKKNMVRIDTIKQYDLTNMEEENSEKQL